MRFNSDCLRAAFMAGAAVSAIVAVAPAAAAAQPTVQINLPAQDLSASLRDLAVQTGQEILFSPAVVARRRAPAISGKLSVREALHRLVAGQPLVIEEPRPNVFVLKRAPETARRDDSAALTRVSAQTAPAGSGQGQTAEGSGTVSGTVTGPNGTGVSGALVRVEGTNLSTVTDANGNYRIVGVPAGEQTLVLEYLGDAPRTEVVQVAAGAESVAEITRELPNDIVVYGFQSGVQRALNQQKNAANSATVVSADLLGQFPAETVSEALRRVPGVGFSRADDTGEGSKITVRGFTSEAIHVQLNGQDLQGTGFERTIDLSGFLAENISEIRIEKSLLPSMDSSGSGGLVKIETKSGLDYGKSYVNLGFETEFNGKKEFGNEWQANATFARKLTPSFGIAATVAYRETDRTNFDAAISGITPPVLPAGITSSSLVPESRDFPYDDAFANRLITGVSYGRRDRTEKNLLASINLAWDVADHTRLRLDAQRNDRDVFTITPRSTISFLTSSFDMPIHELNNEIRRRSVISSLRPNLGLAQSALRYQSNAITLRGDTRLGALTLNYQAGYNRTTSRSNNSNINMLGTANTNVAALVDPATAQFANDDDPARTSRLVDGAFLVLPNGLPVPSLSAAGQAWLSNPANYTMMSSAVRTLTDSTTDDWSVQLDAKYDFGGFVDYIKIGGKYDDNYRTSADDLFASTTVGSLATVQSYAPIAARRPSLADIGPFLQPVNLGLIGGSGYAFPSLFNSDGFFNRFAELSVDDPSTPVNEQRVTFSDLLGLDPITNPSALDATKTIERLWAGYVEGHFKLGQFDLTTGARYERISRTGRTLTTPSIMSATGVAEPRTTFIAAGLVDYADNGGTADKITPVVILNWRPNTNTVARFHYNMSTINPDFRLIRRATQIFIDLRASQNRAVIRESNPDLKPQTVHNFEVGVQHYFDKPAGVVGLNAFYKITQNNFTNVFFEDAANDTVRDRVLDFFGDLVNTRPDLFAFDANTRFQLNRPSNGEGGKIWGVEAELIKQLDFLPGFLGNFGVMGNVTYTTGDFPTLVSGRTDAGALASFTLKKPIAEASEWVYNLSLNYASGGLEGRLIYTHQDASVPSGGYDPNDLNDIIPDYSTLDLRLSYATVLGGNRVTFFLEGDDLLRDPTEPDIRRAVAPAFNRDANYFFPGTLQFNGGRSFTLGIRAAF